MATLKRAPAILLACAALAPAQVFPGRVATDSDLGVAANLVSTKLTSSMSNVSTTFTVQDASRIVPNTLLTVAASNAAPANVEYVWVCAVSGSTISVGRSSCPNTDGRGVDGSSAISHSADELVKANVNALYQKSLAGEIKTLEKNAAGTVQSSLYDWVQTPGGALSSGLSQTITLNPCPLGVAGADTNHYLYISGGTGTPEAALITGGTCTSGAATGTVILTPANSHSGGWIIGSATGGIQEAHNAISGGRIILPTRLDVYATSFLTKGVTISGQGMDFAMPNAAGTVITVHGTGYCAFDSDYLGGFQFESFFLYQAGSDTAGGCGIRLNSTAPSNPNIGTRITNVQMQGQYDSILTDNAAGWVVQGARLSAFVHDAVIVRDTNNPDAGDPSITATEMYASAGTPNACVEQFSAGGLRYVNNKCNGPAHYGYVLNNNVGDTSQILIIASSFDQQTDVSVSLNATHAFPDVVIADNTISCGAATTSWQGVLANQALVNSGSITGNVFVCNGAAGTTGIQITAAQNLHISGNTFLHMQTGVWDSANSNHTHAGANQMINVVVPYAPHDATFFIAGAGPLTFVQLGAINTAENSSFVSCSDCNSTCTAGSSNGNTCTMVNGAWAH